MPLCAEGDLSEPSEGVRTAVASLESLRAQLAKLPSSYLRLGLMQETINCLFGSCVFGAGAALPARANLLLAALLLCTGSRPASGGGCLQVAGGWPNCSTVCHWMLCR